MDIRGLLSKSIFFVGPLLASPLAFSDSTQGNFINLKQISAHSEQEQVEIVKAILGSFVAFKTKASASQLNLELARKGTYLSDLGGKDWNYIKNSILVYGLPAEPHFKIAGTTLYVKKPTSDFIKINFGKVYESKVQIDDKDYAFIFNADNSVEKNDLAFQELFNKATSKSKVEAKTPSVLSFLNLFWKNFIGINYAEASASIVTAPFRAISSLLTGSFKGFSSPVGQTRRFFSGNRSLSGGGVNTRTGKILSYDDNTGTGTASAYGPESAFRFVTVTRSDGTRAFQVEGTGNGLAIPKQH